MWTSPMELKCLLMWLLFGFVRGNKEEKCPPSPRTEFADVTVEMYVPGTELYYECDSGYDRRSGDHPGIKCKREQHGASWAYSGFKCIEKKILLSMGSTTEVHFTQEPESKTQNPAPQKQEDFSEVNQKDFCGPPKALPHASLKVKKHYYVGQELHFKCQSGYDERPPTSGTSTCKKVNGSIIWTPLDMQCTNGSSKCPAWTIEPGTTHPSPSSSVTLPVTMKSFSCCKEDFSGNCGIQMQTCEIDDFPQKKPDCSSNSKMSSGNQGGSLDTQIQCVKEAENITAYFLREQSDFPPTEYC